MDVMQTQLLVLASNVPLVTILIFVKIAIPKWEITDTNFTGKESTGDFIFVQRLTTMNTLAAIISTKLSMVGQGPVIA